LSKVLLAPQFKSQLCFLVIFNLRHRKFRQTDLIAIPTELLHDLIAVVEVVVWRPEMSESGKGSWENGSPADECIISVEHLERRKLEDTIFIDANCSAHFCDAAHAQIDLCVLSLAHPPVVASRDQDRRPRPNVLGLQYFSADGAARDPVDLVGGHESLSVMRRARPTPVLIKFCKSCFLVPFCKLLLGSSNPRLWSGLGRDL
jgi:hypothetical protein